MTIRKKRHAGGPPQCGWECCEFVAASRTVAPAWFAIGIGNVFVIMTMLLVSAGFTVFSGGRPRLWLLFAGPAIWAGCYLGSEVFRDEITYRIADLCHGDL